MTLETLTNPGDNLLKPFSQLRHVLELLESLAQFTQSFKPEAAFQVPRKIKLHPVRATESFALGHQLHVAVHTDHQSLFIFAEKFCDGGLPLVSQNLDPGQALGPERLGFLGERVDVFSRKLAALALYVEGLYYSTLLECAAEDLEVRFSENFAYVF